MRKIRIFFLDHRSIYLNSLGDALSQLGYPLFYQSSWDMREVEAGIRYFKPDILLTVGCDAPLTSPSLNRLPGLVQEYRLFHIYWATEDALFHEEWSLPFVKRIKPHMVWTIDARCVKSYEVHGFAAVPLNFALNPRFFTAKPEDVTEKYEVSLIGTTHLHAPTYRMKSLKVLLVPLLQQGIPVHIWGYGWQEDPESVKKHVGITIPSHLLHGYLPYKETARIYHESKIVLGVQNAEDQVSQRTFEIVGSGGLMLANRTKSLQELFQDGEEVLLSASVEETVRFVLAYLDRREVRQAIGRRGREKILKEHTYRHRLAAIWPKVLQEMNRMR